MKINLIDVGCGVKLFYPFRRAIKHIDNILAFDPFSSLKYKEYIKQHNPRITIHTHNIAVFDKTGKQPFYIYIRKDCSSLFPPNPPIVKKYIKYKVDIKGKQYKKEIKKHTVAEVSKIDCIRLDSMLDKMKINFDFLKIDTEGGTLNVLKSLGRYIDTQIVGLHIEIYSKEIFKGSGLYEEINNFLSKHDFYQAKRLGKKNKFVGDFVYIRKDDNKLEKIKKIKKIYKLRD